jgi:hypothetical protein
LAKYLTYVVDPEFNSDNCSLEVGIDEDGCPISCDYSWSMDAAFGIMREDIDYSKRCIAAGKTGGRGNRKPPLDDAKPPFSETETPNDEPEGNDEPLSAEQKGDGDNAEAKAKQGKAKQGKAVSKRFVKPALAEVEEFVSAKGYTFNPEAFWSYYEAVGWKVGSKPMKNWKAACSTWQQREAKKEVSHDAYSNL